MDYIFFRIYLFYKKKNDSLLLTAYYSIGIESMHPFLFSNDFKYIYKRCEPILKEQNKKSKK